MRVSHVRFLRRASLALILLVLGAVFFNYIQAWRHASHAVQRAAEILSSEMMRSADSVEYSEHQNGVVRFKLNADRLLETRKGLSILQGIDAFDTNADGTPKNHIRSRRGEYDRDTMKGRFYEDVRILTGQGTEIRTNSLMYDRGQEAGWSDDPVVVESRQGKGTARGFRYYHATGTLELLADVNFTVSLVSRPAEGAPQTTRVQVRSDQGHYGESTQLMQFKGHALLESEGTTLSGDTIALSFNPERTHVTSVACEGNARHETRDGNERRLLSGRRMDFAIGSEGQGLERIDVFGGASFASDAPGVDQELRGNEIHVDLDQAKKMPRALQSRGDVDFRLSRDGDVTRVTAGNLDCAFVAGTSLIEQVRVWERASMTMGSGSSGSGDELKAGELLIDFHTVAGRSVASVLNAKGDVRWTAGSREPKPKGPPPPPRTLTAATLEMRYNPEGTSLDSGYASGNVVITETPRDPGSPNGQSRRLQADHVRFRFFGSENRLRAIEADGNTRITTRQAVAGAKPPAFRENETRSPRMSATFREEDGTPDTILQWDGVLLQDGSRTATAQRSEYHGSTDTLVLTGSPQVTDESGVTTGDLVEYSRSGRVVNVRKNVRSTLRPRKNEGTGNLAGSRGSVSVVTADLMQYWTEESRARYSGRVQLLSDTNQLQAQTVDVFESGERLEGFGDVRHLMVRSSSSDETDKGQAAGRPPKPEKKAADSTVIVRCAAFSYRQSERVIRYTGGVTLISEDVVMNSRSLDAVLSEDGKAVERALAREQLTMKQGDRTAKGNLAEYLPGSGTIIVTGTPAEVADPVRGRSQARRLTFHTSDDRILLEN